jgi:intraflagellar transport protein 80
MNLQEIGKTCKSSCLPDRSQSLPNCLLYLDYSSNLYSLQKQSLSQTLDQNTSQSNENPKLSKPTLLYSLSPQDNFEISSFAAFALKSKSIQHLVLGNSMGSLLFLSTSGEVTKTIDNAHNGSVTHLQFSSDGHSLMSAGEDGSVKLWSTSGMLRKKVVSLKSPITSMHWSADTSLLALGLPNTLVIHHFLKNMPNIILPLDPEDSSCPASPLFLSWSPCSQYLLMGTELCRYVLLSANGEILLQSETYLLPFEHGGWLPSSQGFLIASQTQMLCSDIHGKVFIKQKVESKDSILSISLSDNNTQALILQANYKICSLPLLLLTPLYFKHFEVKSNHCEQLIISNTLTGYSEILDTKISQISAIDCNHDHLALIVFDKLVIYDLENPLTPTLQDFTGECPLFLKISSSRIMVACPPQMFLFSLSGKCLSVLRLPSSISNSSLSPESVCFCAESLFISGILIRFIFSFTS